MEKNEFVGSGLKGSQKVKNVANFTLFPEVLLYQI